jgi:uncharacterized membrane protein
MSATQDQPEETAYNQIAGHSIERLAAISDGIFAVAMTLLVLDLRNRRTNSSIASRIFCTPCWHCFPNSTRT